MIQVYFHCLHVIEVCVQGCAADSAEACCLCSISRRLCTCVGDVTAGHYRTARRRLPLMSRGEDVTHTRSRIQSVNQCFSFSAVFLSQLSQLFERSKKSSYKPSLLRFPKSPTGSNSRRNWLEVALNAPKTARIVSLERNMLVIPKLPQSGNHWCELVRRILQVPQMDDQQAT